jgi:hypothetical protein
MSFIYIYIYTLSPPYIKWLFPFWLKSNWFFYFYQMQQAGAFTLSETVSFFQDNAFMTQEMTTFLVKQAANSYNWGGDIITARRRIFTNAWMTSRRVNRGIVWFFHHKKHIYYDRRLGELNTSFFFLYNEIIYKPLCLYHK